jgi:hypothetical protein
VKSFLAHMNLARAIILLGVLGSAYLGWIGWERHQEVSFLRETFQVQVPNLAKAHQELSLLNSKLARDIKGDQFIGNESPESYVRYCADNPAVQLGEVTTDLSSRPGPSGTIDNKITIRPVDTKRAFTHAQVAAFLYRLEADSNQIKVTNLTYRLQGKTKPDEIPGDEWTYEATITNRVKDTSKSGS